MNAKQTAPLIVTLPALAAAAPPLLIGCAIGCGIYFGLKWLLSEDDKQKQPEAARAKAEAESARKATETTLQTPVFRQVPAEIPVKPATVPVPSTCQPVVASLLPAPLPPQATLPAPAPVVMPVASNSAQGSLLPIKRKVVTRQDLATVFQRGARALNRAVAVATLKRLGFGKTVAYDALSADGRFSSWLQIAPDGIITWKDRQNRDWEADQTG